MKIDKKIFISVLLVLMVLGVIGTVSATDSLDGNLTAEDADAVSVDMSVSTQDSLDSTNEDSLSEGETTIYVDGSYDGDEQGTEEMPYKTISAAASAATGGETIFIKNGEYTVESKISGIAKPLTFTGESYGGVIIKAGTGGFFDTTNMCIYLVFNNLYFKDIACSGASVTINIGGITEGQTNNVTISNCIFDNCSGRYGAVRIFAKFGDVTIDNCKFLNTKATGRYASAICFGSAGPNTYTIRNTIVNGTTNDASNFGAIYVDRAAAGPTILDNVTVVDCSLSGVNGLISTKGPLNITNSKIVNNNVDVGSLAAGSLIWIQASTSAPPEVNVETTIIANNTGTNYLVGATGDSVAVNVNYNNIQNNTVNTNVSYSDAYNMDYNYWGSNDEPTGVTVNNWAIENGGVFTLNDGSPLAKPIPSTEEPQIGDENTTFVSVDGDDSNTGSSDSPVATIAKAVELAQNRTGEIIVNAGTYTENNIIINSTVPISILGLGDVLIDGNASSNSIFKILGGEVTFTNLRFTNNKPRYGGAIMINYATGGGSRTIIDINVTVNNCTFENIEATSRGGGIYAAYTKGNLIVNDSHFINSSASSWGGGIAVVQSATSNGLNVEIRDSTFEQCYGNNGGACYLNANTLTVVNSVFDNNTAKYDSAAMQIYNSTASIDNCIITNNKGGGKGVAIKEVIANKVVRTLTITNSVIENNNGVDATYPAIYVDQNALDISYCSIVNDLSLETNTATGYDAVYGQGVAIANNNWWGTNDPSTKVTGTNITMDNWVIMNVEANVTEALVEDKVKLTIDFNHVNTTSGEIEELTGGTIPKTHVVQLSADSGTFVPQTLTIKDDAVKSSVYTVGNVNDVVSIVSEEAVVEMSFLPETAPYYGIIYVSKDGDDNNNGSEEAPVATIAKAIELAFIAGGSGQIIVNEGTYNGCDYLVTKDLTITGVGDVIFDAEQQGRFFNLPSGNSIDTFALNNLTLTNAGSGYGAIIYNYAATNIILNNVTIVNNDNDGISNLITTNGNNLVINNSEISDNTAGRIIAVSGKYDSSAKYVTIVNTTFEDNVATDYNIVDVATSSGSLTLNLTDSHFINNVGKLGIVSTDSKTTMNVKGTDFVDNTNTLSSGGAISAYKLNVDTSSFINNKAYRNGGAIYVNYNGGDAVITKSRFINNTAGEKGDAIYNSNKVTINYSVLLTNSTGYLIYHDGGENVLNAQYNWWGTNDNPESLIGTGSYEDDWGYDEDCEFDASNWVVMNVNNNLTSETLNIDDQIEFTVDFNHYLDSTGTIQELTDSIPEVDVSASTVNGELDKVIDVTENNVVTFVYTATTGGEDTITITSTDAVNTTTINVNGPVVIDVIYVSVDGDDNNNGSEDAPVATIAHAIEIAENGKIVIMAGEYTIDSTLVVNNDLDIRGDGDVVINGNLNRIIENTANLNLTNLSFTNAKAAMGSVILDDGNVTINGCTFYGNNATSSTGGSIINNRKGTMTVDDSKFYGNIASRGAIASQSGTNLVVNNSEFYDNDMTPIGTSYGIIYSTSADTIVENTVFRNNKAKQGAGVWASRSTSATTGSLEVINCTFENNVAQTGTGGAVFTSGKVTAHIEDSIFINNSAVKSDSGVGGNGGAIYTTGTSSVDVINSVFIDNQGSEDAGIYVGATGSSSSSLDISNSVILAKDGDTNFALYAADGAIVTAEDNFWGDNAKANTNADVERWIIMNATFDEDSGVLTVSFNMTNSTDGRIADYLEALPDGFTVSVTSSSGALDEVLPVVAGQASTAYAPSSEDRFLTVKSGNAEVIIPLTVKPDVIYVSVDGDDSNIGSEDAPVATIAHAIEIAENGKIIILEGTYTTGDLGIISNDLNITGQGTVVIDAQNNNRILYVGEDANVVLENLIMINGAHADESGALLGNSNLLTLINCTLANSSAGEHNGGAIYNVGKLTIINSTIANNTAKEGGAIFTNDALAVGPEITIINSTFENNIANGNNNLGGGAIFAQQLAGLTIVNTTFRNNEALSSSSGGAIFISHSTADLTIDDSEFIDNHANGQDGTGGGAIYMAGTSNYERKGKLSISNTLFEGNTADENGAAIYARATTVDVTNSVIFANKDPNGFAVYGYKTDQVAPAITLNDNWWGTNVNPTDFVGGYNYNPTLTRWVILTATNDTPFVEGETVKITVNLDTWTDGEENGTLATPITIPRDVVIETTFDVIEGVMENGEFTTDYVVPADLKLVTATVDIQTVELFKVKDNTVVEVEDITAEKGETVLINATIKTVDGDIVEYGGVEIYVDDELIANTTFVGGSVTQEFVVDKEIGSYPISVKFIDLTGDFIDSESSATLNVTGIILTVDAPDSCYYGDDENISVIVTDGDLNPIEGVSVVIQIGDDNYTEDSDSNGQVIFPLNKILPGQYNVTVIAVGNYVNTTANAEVEIYKLASDLVADSIKIDNVNYVVATLTDGNGNAIDQAEVTLEIDGQSYTNITDADGQVMFSCENVPQGTYAATVSYEGDEIYNSSAANVNVVVKSIVDISVAYDPVAHELTATFVNNDTGKGLVYANVAVNIDGADQTLKTDAHGKVKVSVADLDLGHHTATFSYKGNNKYNPASATIDFVFKSNVDISVVYDGDAEEIVATFVNNDTGKGLVYAHVVVNIDGVDYALETDAHGKVNVSTADLDLGTHTATASYKGNSKYNPTSASTSFAVKYNVDISIVYDFSADEITATFINNRTGKGLVSANVVVNIDGVDYALKTNSKGQVKISTADLELGAHTATASYGGSNKYDPASATVNFVVKTNVAISAVYDADADELVATFVKNDTGKALVSANVVVNLDGVDYALKTDSHGKVKVSTADLAPGEYTATISYKGSGKYNPSSIETDIVKQS